MQKLVVLKLDGGLDKGVRVTLEIGKEGTRPTTEILGDLPPQPELVEQYQDWQSAYRSLGTFLRITPIKVSMGGSLTDPHENCKKLGDRLSHQLNSWLNAESFRPIKETLLKQLAPDDTVRVLIKTDNIWLRRLPWQSWNVLDDYSQAEVALSAPEYVQLGRAKTVTKRKKIKKKIKILAILGNSDGIAIDKDREILKQLLDAETTFLVEPTRHTLNNKIWEQDWDILFFAGHSSSQEDGETGRIYINQTDSLTIYELKYALREAVESGLQLAIFNSCDGLGLARQLEDLHIPQILVMREPVPDKVAQEFLTYFLTQFSGGKSLYLAVRKAREKLQGLEDEFPCASWLPALCQIPSKVPPTWKDLLPRTKRDRIQFSLIASVATTLLVLGLRYLGMLQAWELQAYDQLMQLRPAEKLDPRLLIVKVTAEDIKKLGGEYPLSDRTILRLLKKLEEHQPRVIGLDIYRDRPVGEGHADLVKYLQKSEAQGARSASRVIPVCVAPSAEIPEGVAPPPGVSEERQGFGDAVPDPDGIVRRHLLAMKPPAASSCSTYYALSLQLALHYLKAKGISLQLIAKNHWQLGPVAFKTLAANTGFYHRQVELQGFQLLLNYRKNQSSEEIGERVTLTDVLTNRVKPNFVKDKIILIGITDPTVKDEVNTPYNQEIRGLLLHAQMVSQILSAVEEQRSLLWFSPLWVDGFWIWAWSLMGGILTYYSVPSPTRLVLTGTVAIILLNGICFIFLLTSGGVLPLVPSALALVATGGSIGACRVFQTQRPQ